jgi:hypothetical protein
MSGLLQKLDRTLKITDFFTKPNIDIKACNITVVITVITIVIFFFYRDKFINGIIK